MAREIFVKVHDKIKKKLQFATQTEAFDHYDVTAVGKDGGDDTKSVAVEIATQARVNFLFPPLQRVTLGLVDMADFSQSST